MEIEVTQEVMRQLKEILIRGGEMKIVVEKRGNERIPTIFCWPNNKIICRTERLAE